MLPLLALAAFAQDAPVPRLDDLARGLAEWTLDVPETGLLPGASDTVVSPDGRVRSYAHASTDATGVRDSKGRRVEAPGCAAAWESRDGGKSFKAPTQCVFDGRARFPRVAASDEGTLVMAYERDGSLFLRTSDDEGDSWSEETKVPGTGDLQPPCPPETVVGSCRGFGEQAPKDPLLAGRIAGQSPYGAPAKGSCFAGGAPGVFVEGEELFVFASLGSCPARLGCFRGALKDGAAGLKPCTTPVLSGAPSQGESLGKDGNPFFDHRFLGAAEIVRERGRWYLLFEGERGPMPPEYDSQWGLGLAWTDKLDGAWTRFARNPILADLPGDAAIGHADLVRIDGLWRLYAAATGGPRGRYRLSWKKAPDERGRSSLELQETP